ncbi:hypothetical protein AB0F11_23060 [Streptomyces sp. NPDC032472]
MFATDLDAAARSVRTIAAHTPTTVYIGHGGPLAAQSVERAFR